MNDPHVVALLYRVEHDTTHDYESAAPLLGEGPGFRVRIEGKTARFEMSDHYASDVDARATVDPFIEAWELEVLLREGPGSFKLTYQDAEIIDRKPPPGAVIHLRAATATAKGYGMVTMTHPRYPAPPRTLAVTPDVEVMAYRYRAFCEGHDTLAAMAYFCLTVLEASAKGGQRSAAAKQYLIDANVLTTLNRLAGGKGGLEARKHKARGADLTPQERAWIEAAVKAITRRAAEAAHTPNLRANPITMADLPPL